MSDEDDNDFEEFMMFDMINKSSSGEGCCLTTLVMFIIIPTAIIAILVKLI